MVMIEDTALRTFSLSTSSLVLETSCKKTKHASGQKLGTPAIEERYIHQLKPSPSSKTYSPFPESCTHLSKPLGEGRRWGVVISASSKLFHLHSHCRGLLVVNLTNSVPLEFQPIQKLDSLQQHTDVVNSTRDGITCPENVIKFCLTFTKPKTSWILFIFHLHKFQALEFPWHFPILSCFWPAATDGNTWSYGSTTNLYCLIHPDLHHSLEVLAI